MANELSIVVREEQLEDIGAARSLSDAAFEQPDEGESSMPSVRAGASTFLWSPNAAAESSDILCFPACPWYSTTAAA